MQNVGKNYILEFKNVVLANVLHQPKVSWQNLARLIDVSGLSAGVHKTLFYAHFRIMAD